MADNDTVLEANVVVKQEHVDAAVEALKSFGGNVATGAGFALPANLAPVVLHALKAGGVAMVDDLAKNYKSIDWGAMSFLVTMFGDQLIALLKSLVNSFNTPSVTPQPAGGGEGGVDVNVG
jgi:hypothetical protein